jgi:DNA polymerase-3 subunit alpha
MLTFNRELNQHNENQNSLFATIETPKARLILQTVEPATQDEKLGWEKELLGLYVSGHPLDKHREIIEKSGKSIAKLEHALKGTTLTIAGVIEDVKEIMTRKGDKMAFVRISDFTGSIECVIFPKTFEEYRGMLKIDLCVVIKAKNSDREGEQSLIVDSIKKL